MESIVFFLLFLYFRNQKAKAGSYGPESDWRAGFDAAWAMLGLAVLWLLFSVFATSGFGG